MIENFPNTLETFFVVNGSRDNRLSQIAEGVFCFGKLIGGYQITCYALNDLKGHLPVSCFAALRDTSAWKQLMRDWKHQAETDPADRDALKRLIRPNARAKKKRRKKLVGTT